MDTAGPGITRSVTPLRSILACLFPLIAVGCATVTEDEGSVVTLTASDLVVPPSVPIGFGQAGYERPKATVTWDLATLSAEDGTPLTGYLVYEGSTVALGGRSTEPGQLRVHSHRGTVLTLQVLQAHNLSEASALSRGSAAASLPLAYLDRALRDASLGSPVIGAKTTEFSLEFIWIPDNQESTTPLNISRVEVRSTARQAFSLYRESAP